MLMKPNQFELESSLDVRPIKARKSMLSAAVEWLEAYATYKRQKQDLLSLDDHLLKDIGISRADAERIAKQPFRGVAHSLNGSRK